MTIRPSFQLPGQWCRDVATISLVVASSTTSHIQEAHQVILHYLCGAVEQRLFPELVKR